MFKTDHYLENKEQALKTQNFKPDHYLENKERDFKTQNFKLKHNLCKKQEQRFKNPEFLNRTTI